MRMRRSEFAQKYALFECVQCGKCTGGCPISIKSRLNIRRLIYEALTHESLEILRREEIWDCTTCSTCKLRCPKEVEPVDAIIGMRSFLVEGGRIKPTIRDALESTFKYGNPWGRIREKRSEWADGLEVKNIAEGAEVLYFIGCTPSYDSRVQKVARALVEVFNEAGVDFGTLGNEENCCGSEVRRMGEEGLFELLIEENSELFGRYTVKRIVTTSPHCYNTFKNEYGGMDCEVEHYTQFVAELIERGKLSFSKEIKKVVTYQDPCFLGKQNKIYEEPRKIIESIPGIEFVEMDRSKERSLCCEGGGGRMWVEATDSGERLAEIRVKEVAAIGADIIATSCPFCLLTLDDAVKVTGYEDRIEVMDIAELVAVAI